MDLKLQLYNGKKDNQGIVTSLTQIIGTITGPSLKPFVLTGIYKNILNTTDATEKEKLQLQYDAAKGQLPAVTWSGTFSKRKAANIMHYSQLICLDVDKLEFAADLKRQIIKDEFVKLLFISPSGHGLKIIVHTTGTPQSHKDYFNALKNYFETKYKIEVDPSGKDVSRLCFLCHDADLFYNSTSKQFSLTESPKENKPAPALTKPQQTKLTGTTENCQDVFDFTSNILTYTEGNRNRFIYLFANNCNRKGISMADCSNYGFANFTDREPEELRQTIENAYNNNIAENGKYKKGTKAAVQTDSKEIKKFNSEHLPTGGKTTKASEPVTQFWRKYKIKKGKGEEGYEKEIIELNRVDFSDFLFQNGFHLLHTGKAGYQLCQSGAGVIKPVEPHHVKQYVLLWCKKQGYRDVEEMLRKGQKQYFAANELDALPYKDIEVKKDTHENSFFYFKNCWVSVSESEIKTHPYSELTEYIWEGNKIDRDFKLDPQSIDDENENVTPQAMDCEFARFLYYFSYNPKCPEEKDFDPKTINERFWSIATAYGYLLDGYKHPAERKGIFAVDHKIGEKGEQNGRTGKSILPKAASYLKVVAPINGKSFKPDYQFKYEQITRDTQIVNFNDMQRNFDVEQIFEVIADDYSVIRRANGYVDFKYYDSPKVYYSTNFTPSGEGASYSGRMHVIEASDYFSDTHSPYDEFKHSLFTDWTDQEWNRFYNFSLQCVQSFKTIGLLKYPKSNFDMRKLINSVVPEFIDFMDADCLFNERIEKVALLEKFNVVYSSLYSQKLKPHTFHKWVKAYAKNRQLQFNPHRGGSFDKSNGKEYYVLANADFKKENLKHDNDLFSQPKN